MEQLIADYIREFLFDTSELNIKDLGIFSTDFIPAEYDASMKVIEPPKKILKFSEEATYTTPTFLQFMAEKNDFSVTAAAPYIERFVKTIKDTVGSSKDISLRGLGKFEPGLMGGLQFKPDLSVNFLRSTQNSTPVEVPSSSYEREMDKKASFVEEDAVNIPDTTAFKDVYNSNNSLEAKVDNTKEKYDVNQTQVIDRKTVTDVLENNKKVIDEQKQESATGFGSIFSPKQPDEIEEEEEAKTSPWLWAFPIAILLLLGSMLAQIALSDKPINQMAPFSWFMSDGDELADNGKQYESYNSSGETETIAVEEGDNSNGSANNDNSATTAADVGLENTIVSDKTNTTNKKEDDNLSRRTGANTSNEAAEVKNNTSTSSSSSNNSATAAGSNIPSSISSVLTKNPVKGYYIVTGSFGEPRNALKMFHKVQSRGFSPTLYRNTKGLYQVGVYAPNGAENARQLLPQIKSSVEAGAFINRMK